MGHNHSVEKSTDKVECSDTSFLSNRYFQSQFRSTNRRHRFEYVCIPFMLIFYFKLLKQSSNLTIFYKGQICSSTIALGSRILFQIAIFRIFYAILDGRCIDYFGIFCLQLRQNWNTFRIQYFKDSYTRTSHGCTGKSVYVCLNLCRVDNTISSQAQLSQLVHHRLDLTKCTCDLIMIFFLV